MEFRTAYSKRVRVTHSTEGPSLAKQAYRDECDVNNILRKYQQTGTLPEPGADGRYGDFSGIVDYQDALNAVIEAESMFEALPARVRDRFANDPAQLLSFVNDVKNRDEAIALGLIEPPKAAVTTPPTGVPQKGDTGGAPNTPPKP